MKPCKISSISLGVRPKSSRLEVSKSESKIYCKPLLPNKVMRVSTAEIITGRQWLTDEGTEFVNKMEKIGKGKVDAWSANRLPD